jgi:dTDP-4-amino-4,6-dideoxygalactose transaminase
VHADLGYPERAFPIAERVAAECLSLPMFPELTHEQQEAVVAALAEAVQDLSPLDATHSASRG